MRRKQQIVMFTRNPKYRKTDRFMFYVTILLLACVAIAGILMGTSAISITHGFGENPVFKSKLVFKMRDKSMVDMTGLPLFKHFTSEKGSEKGESTTEKIPETEIQPNNTDESRRKRNLIKLSGLMEILEIDPREVDQGDFGGYTEQDLLFLSTMTIDIHHSKWGPISLRDYIIFYPFFMEIVALIMITILIAYRTGRNKKWGLSQPWMIVVPSIVVFGIMTVLTTIFWIVNMVVWTDLCLNVRSQLVDSELDCIIVIMALQETPPDLYHLPFSFYVHVFRHFPEIAMLLWIACLVIMILRCIFMVDFQLVNVTVKLIDVPGLPEFSDDLKQQPDPGIFLKVTEPGKEVQMLSQERISEDDFQSAHSTLTTFTVHEGDHPSLEPLLMPGRQEDQTIV